MLANPRMYPAPLRQDSQPGEAFADQNQATLSLWSKFNPEYLVHLV